MLLQFTGLYFSYGSVTLHTHTHTHTHIIFTSSPTSTLFPYLVVMDVAVRGSGLVAKSCLTLANPWSVAHQASLSMGFSRQEYWNGLPFPSPGDLHDPGIEPMSPALQAYSLPLSRWGSSKGQLLMWTAGPQWGGRQDGGVNACGSRAESWLLRY